MACRERAIAAAAKTRKLDSTQPTAHFTAASTTQPASTATANPTD
jgi:hypothetical protein